MGLNAFLFYYDRSVDLNGGKSQVQDPGDKGESYDASEYQLPSRSNSGDDNDKVMIFAPLNITILLILQRINMAKMI